MLFVLTREIAHISFKQGTRQLAKLFLAGTLFWFGACQQSGNIASAQELEDLGPILVEEEDEDLTQESEESLEDPAETGGAEELLSDSGLQQLLDALEAEPDLGPIPLESLDRQAEAVSPYRLFVDLGVRGTTNAGNLPSDRSLENDVIFSPALTFLALPDISDNAQLLASLSGGTSLYGSEDDLEFAFISGSIGANWDFAPLWFMRSELQGQQFFALDGDDYQSLSLQYQVGRNNVLLNSNLLVRTYYQLRGSLTNDSDLDRLGNSLNVSAQFPLNRRLQGRIFYRLLVDSFVNNSRTDLFNRIGGEIRYTISDILSVRGFTAYGNNLSSEDERDYDEVSFGLGFTANFPLGKGR